MDSKQIKIRMPVKYEFSAYAGKDSEGRVRPSTLVSGIGKVKARHPTKTGERIVVYDAANDRTVTLRPGQLSAA